MIRQINAVSVSRIALKQQMEPHPRKFLATAAVVSAASTAAASPLVRAFVKELGVLDHPNHRSSHVAITPRSGGLACIAGAAVASIFKDNGYSHLASPTTTALVGLLDDLTGDISPGIRLIAQATVGALTGRAVGSSVGGFVLFPAVVNIANFMDGINGITGLTFVVWGTHAASLSELQLEDRWLAAIAAGAALGFLPFNMPDASMFLGDVGSYFFGSLAATVITHSLGAGPKVFLQVCAPLAIYGTDAVQAIMSGRRQGAAVTSPHRRHIYQQLVDDGRLSHTHTSLITAGCALLTGLLLRKDVTPLRLMATGVVATGYLLAPSLARRLISCE